MGRDSWAAVSRRLIGIDLLFDIDLGDTELVEEVVDGNLFGRCIISHEMLIDRLSVDRGGRVGHTAQVCLDLVPIVGGEDRASALELILDLV